MGAGGFPGEWRVGMTGAARGVCAGVLGSLLLISPAEAEAEPDAAPFPPAGRLGCWRNREKSPINNKNYFFFFLKRETLCKKQLRVNHLCGWGQKRCPSASWLHLIIVVGVFLAWQLWFRMWCLQATWEEAPWEMLIAASDWVTVLWKSLPSFLYIFFPRIPIKQDNF